MFARTFAQLSQELGSADRVHEVWEANTPRGNSGPSITTHEKRQNEILRSNVNGFVAHMGPRSDDRVRTLAGLGYGLDYEFMGNTFSSASKRTIRRSKLEGAQILAISTHRKPRKTRQSVHLAEQSAMGEDLCANGKVDSGSANGSVGVFFSKEEVYLLYRSNYKQIMVIALKKDPSIMPSKKLQDSGKLTRSQRNLMLISRGEGVVPLWAGTALQAKQNKLKSASVGNTSGSGGPTNTITVDGVDYLVGTYRLFKGFDATDADRQRLEILTPPVPLRMFPFRGISLTSVDFRTFLRPNAVTHTGWGVLSANVMDFFFEMLDEKYHHVHASLRSRWYPAVSKVSTDGSPPKYTQEIKVMSQHFAWKDAPTVHIVESQLILVPIFIGGSLSKKKKSCEKDVWVLGVIDLAQQTISVFD